MELALKFIEENYDNLNLIKQKCPTYVEMYEKTNVDVILVCAKNKSSSGTSENDARNNKRESEELDLTGSPLKLDLSLHTVFDDTIMSEETQLWSKDEVTHLPISIEMARKIANLYNKTITELPKNDVIPMWLLCNPTAEGKPLLLAIESNEECFNRGIVVYQDYSLFDDIDVGILIEEYAKQEQISEDLVNVCVDCKYTVSGISYSSCSTEELLNAPHGGATELHCEWNSKTLQTPFISCKVNFVQEVIIGHLASPCTTIWKSVCALHNMNQLLVDMTAAGSSSVDLETAVIRPQITGQKKFDTTKRLNELLNQTEMYAYTAEYPPGGCICITEDTSSLKMCMSELRSSGSSNDFTYQLWDILRDCDTAEELISLLIQALKFISSGKIRPFIDVNNKTYLSKLVLKLSRGHSQSGKVLKNLRSSPPQALSLVAQVGTEKIMWEYTKIMSLLEHSFFIAGIWTSDARTQESIEQINQTINDMTMSGGDFTLNPFESLSTNENSIRLDCESFYEDDPNELTVDDFASLKKHGLVGEKKDVNEVPLITDEIDISPWKNLLMKFAQVHVCLEHLYRAEICLRADFASLKPIASRLLEYYVSEKSPVRTVGQLMSDPLQKTSMPISNSIAQDHLKKPALWYRVELKKKGNCSTGIRRDCKTVHVFSQQPVFPPTVWQHIEPLNEDNVAEVTTISDDLKYHHTKYIHISNKLKNKIIFPCS